MYQNRIYNAQSAATDTDAMTLRMRAQSLLTRNGVVAELPTYEEAVRVLGQHDAEARV